MYYKATIIFVPIAITAFLIINYIITQVDNGFSTCQSLLGQLGQSISSDDRIKCLQVASDYAYLNIIFVFFKPILLGIGIIIFVMDTIYMLTRSYNMKRNR